MEPLKNSSIAQIKDAPGLFISDRFAARSLPLLKSLNITHVLSVTRLEDAPRFAPESGIIFKHISIDDDPFEDLLRHLKIACDWIETGLQSESGDGSTDEPEQVGVLVHCTQGISRSGSIVIAYLMRHLSLPYSSVLSLARSSRPLISPNTGFEYQLRIWGYCQYDIYAVDATTSATGAMLREKPAYKAWKAERDNVMNGGEEAVNKARFSSMASMAAQFGRRRLEKEEGGENENARVGEEKVKSESWVKVEKMEQEWTRRLIAGEMMMGDERVETGATEK